MKIGRAGGTCENVGKIMENTMTDNMLNNESLETMRDLYIWKYAQKFHCTAESSFFQNRSPLDFTFQHQPFFTRRFDRFNKFIFVFFKSFFFILNIDY